MIFSLFNQETQDSSWKLETANGKQWTEVSMADDGGGGQVDPVKVSGRNGQRWSIWIVPMGWADCEVFPIVLTVPVYDKARFGCTITIDKRHFASGGVQQVLTSVEKIMKADGISTSVADKAVLQLAVSADLAEAVSPYNHCKVRLFQNLPTIGKDLLVADLEAPAYTGYAASATVTWGTPILESDSSWTSIAPSVQFQVTSGEGQTFSDVTGIALVDGADVTKVYAVALLPEPIHMDAVGKGFAVVCEINQGNEGVAFSATIVE